MTGYRSAQLSNAFGVAPRHLQWLDERRIVRPDNRHSAGVRIGPRFYSLTTALVIGIIAELRTKTVSLQVIRPFLPKIANRLHADLPMFVILSKESVQFADNPADVVRICGKLTTAAYLVDVATLVRKLKRVERNRGRMIRGE